MKRLLLLAGILLPIAICPTQAQYPTVPDSVKQRAAQENAIHHKLSEAAWKKALKTVKKEEKKYGRVYRPWASKPEDLPQCQIPAFPGAEGGGAFTAGGRGGKVFTVTSLEDRGPGTLREACESGGARIVVFNVAGVIRLKSPISIKAPYITIAGQTAPGDGVCVTGASFLIDTHDVIIRHMRFRRGAVDVADRDDALGGNAVGNIILDHISASWGLDEVMSIYRHVWNRDETGKGTKLPTVNITIQNSMFAEALDTYNHAFGATIGGHNCYFARNLFASNISRNCSVGMNGGFNLVNSVIYNWWNRSIDGGDEYSQFNIINNYFKPGPITALQTGRPICYTSADSCFQIAAHEKHFGLEKLYRLCEIAYKHVQPYRIGRVIARPFIGEKSGEFTRTTRRRDYAAQPFGDTLLDKALAAGRKVYAVGAINDIYAHRGISNPVHATELPGLWDATLKAMAEAPDGSLVFTNFEDFDMYYGHRRNVEGYARALEYFDSRLPDILPCLKQDDVCFITADHGNDPSYKGTDHTREQVPVLMFGRGIRPRSLGQRETYADLGQTAADILQLPPLAAGISFR